MNRALSLLIEDRQPYTTLAALELNSIAQGIEVLDAVVKEAPIRVLLAQASSPGKYLVLFTGEVDEASRSLARGAETAGNALVDELLLPAAEAGLRTALWGEPPPGGLLEPPLPALGVLETFTAPSLLGAADTALKTGATRLEAVRLLAGIGGKSTALLTGDVESVRVAVDAGAHYAQSRELLTRRVVIPRPDPAILPFLLGKPPQDQR